LLSIAAGAADLTIAADRSSVRPEPKITRIRRRRPPPSRLGPVALRGAAAADAARPLGLSARAPRARVRMSNDEQRGEGTPAAKSACSVRQNRRRGIGVSLLGTRWRIRLPG
jgi:hypothetical protein